MSVTPRLAVVAALGVLLVFAAPAHGIMVGGVAAALTLAVALDLLLAPSPRTVSLTRSGATSTRLGEPATVELLVSAAARPLRGMLRDAWPPSAGAQPARHRLAVPAGEQRRFVTTLTPSRRGDRRAAGVTLRVSGPLGLAARQRTRPAPWSVRVLPPFTSRRYLPEKLARLRQLDGLVVAPVRGQGTEFDSLREYVVGDDTRAIDWRATARRGEVVIRTWRPERDRQLLLVLDSGRTSAARIDDATRFDTSLDAALLLTALARHAGDRVGLMVHDARLRAAIDSSSGATLNAVVRETASHDPVLVETDMQAVVAQVLRRLRRRSLVVLFTAIEPAAVREGLQPALAPLLRRHVVLVASVTDPEAARLARGRDSATAVYGAAAAVSADSERALVADELRQRGVEVVEAAPAEFASELADAYLRLKATGRL